VDYCAASRTRIFPNRFGEGFRSSWISRRLACQAVAAAGEGWSSEKVLATHKHPDSKSSLARWYAIMRKGRFLNFLQLREIFPHADQVGKFTVFNIAGNKVRLIAAVHYNRNKIYPAVAGPRVDSSGVRRGQLEKVICQSLNSKT